MTTTDLKKPRLLWNFAGFAWLRKSEDRLTYLGHFDSEEEARLYLRERNIDFEQQHDPEFVNN